MSRRDDILALVRDGLTDRQAAARLGVSRALVSRERHAAGIAANRLDSATARAVRSEGLRARRRRDAQAEAALATSRGWPADLPLAAVAILERLCLGGPASRDGLAAALRLSNSRVNRCAALLVAAGLAHRIEGPREGSAGRAAGLYFPAMVAVETYLARRQQEAQPCA